MKNREHSLSYTFSIALIPTGDVFLHAFSLIVAVGSSISHTRAHTPAETPKNERNRSSFVIDNELLPRHCIIANPSTINSSSTGVHVFSRFFPLELMVAVGRKLRCCASLTFVGNVADLTSCACAHPAAHCAAHHRPCAHVADHETSALRLSFKKSDFTIHHMAH